LRRRRGDRGKRRWGDLKSKVRRFEGLRRRRGKEGMGRFKIEG
jgi:hypothetical protein